MGSQTVELIGRHHLIADLMRAGLEVALPVRDRVDGPEDGEALSRLYAPSPALLAPTDARLLG